MTAVQSRRKARIYAISGGCFTPYGSQYGKHTPENGGFEAMFKLGRRPDKVTQADLDAVKRHNAVLLGELKQERQQRRALQHTVNTLKELIERRLDQ